VQNRNPAGNALAIMTLLFSVAILPSTGQATAPPTERDAAEPVISSDDSEWAYCRRACDLVWDYDNRQCRKLPEKPKKARERCWRRANEARSQCYRECEKEAQR
jgi:hypothetical protein